MSDLISRQAAIDAVVGWFCDLLGVEEISEDLGCLVRLRELPSAHPEHECRTCRYNHLEWSEEPCDSCTSGGESNHWKPKEPEPKKGKWIDMGDFEQCSACTGTHLKEVNTVYGKAIWIKSAYCPNCGADMRGKQE